MFSDAGNNIGYADLIEAQEELEHALGVEVDLVPDTRVIARMRPGIKRDLKVIYEGQ